MARRHSVLFVGTSPARGSEAERCLRSRGLDFDFHMPYAERGGFAPLVSGHDLIVLDVPGSVRQLPGLLLFGRTDGERLAGAVPAAASDTEGLGETAVNLLAQRNDEAAANERWTSGDALEGLDELIAGLPGVIFRCKLAPTSTIDFVSGQIAAVTGRPPERFLGHRGERLLALVHRSDRRHLLDIIRGAREHGGVFTEEHRVVGVDGEPKWIWLRACVREDEGGVRLDGFAVDISERKQEEQALAYLANHDALTGLANRTLFLEQVDTSRQHADRHGETIACLFVDLDHFKQINDSFGHDFGDELLRQVASRLRRCVRGNDSIARLGGDEFTVLLDGIDTAQDAGVAARKILEALAEPFAVRGRKLTVSASIGISCYPGDADGGAALLRNADAAMYQVKYEGRHGFRFHSTELSRRSHEQFALTSGLREVIADADGNGLHVHYQPRIDLGSGKVIAFEALARWQHPELGRVSPARFIPLAEEAGLIVPLGEVLLRQVCRQVAEWDRQGMAQLPVSVNISSRQLCDRDFPRQVQQVLAATGVQAGRLEFEIAETTMIHDYSLALDVTQRLCALGVKLAVDDFGSGHSSLSLLQKLPLKYLKVDSAFMRDLPDERNHSAISEAIIAMARHLDLRVVAEGIETKSQGEFARTSGYDEAQGFLFGRPVPGNEVRRLFERAVH